MLPGLAVAKYFYPRPPRGGRHPPNLSATPRRNFYPRPPRGGRRSSAGRPADAGRHFYPRPPRGGRPWRASPLTLTSRFLSTPSACRGNVFFLIYHAYKKFFINSIRVVGDALYYNHDDKKSRISIHALREEGDIFHITVLPTSTYFYPRPPRGGRLSDTNTMHMMQRFLSTPSARRATSPILPMPEILPEFLSTPSARRATCRR